MRWTKDLILVPDPGRAGLPHPAHLQERKLSTSKPRYKGGEKVYHCGVEGQQKCPVKCAA